MRPLRQILGKPRSESVIMQHLRQPVALSGLGRGVWQTADVATLSMQIDIRRVLRCPTVQPKAVSAGPWHVEIDKSE